MIARPTAARGSFPYPHRTVAEVDAAAAFAVAANAYTAVAPHVTWCSQCDGLVHNAAITFCASQFCPLRKAMAA